VPGSGTDFLMPDRGYALNFAIYVVRYGLRLSSTPPDRLGPWTTIEFVRGEMDDGWIQQVGVQEQATLRKKN